MQEMNPFARLDVYPSWFVNALEKFLSVGSSGFQVIPTDATHLKVPAGAADQAACISIEGLWRFVEADVGPIAHPGGAAGSYPVFVTCKNNNITNVPNPYTDATDYTFGLQIKAPGATPTIVAGTVDQFRKVADAVWDGAKIVRVQQYVPDEPSHAFQHITGGADPIAPVDIGAAPEVELNAVETALLQPGFVGANDGVVAFTPPSGATATRSIAISGSAVKAWVMSVAGVLTAVTIPASAGPFTFPAFAAGTYLLFGVEMDTAGAITLVQASATQSSVANAFSNSPATTAGKVRMMDVVMTTPDGTAAAMTIAGTLDRRPWARGAYYNANFPNHAGTTVMPNSAWGQPYIDWQMRMECSGAPVEVSVMGLAINCGTTLTNMYGGVTVDGVTPTPTAAVLLERTAQSSVWKAYNFTAVCTPTAGSRLLAIAVFYAASGAVVDVSYGPIVTVKELLRQNKRNAAS